MTTDLTAAPTGTSAYADVNGINLYDDIGDSPLLAQTALTFLDAPEG